MFLNLDQKGFTLIEGVVAAGVLGVGLMAYASLQGGIVKQNQKNTDKSKAVTLAQDKIESFKNLAIKLPKDDSLTSPVFTNDTWTSSDGEFLDFEGKVKSESSDYKRTWSISADSDISYLYNVSVSVGPVDETKSQNDSDQKRERVTVLSKISQDSRLDDLEDFENENFIQTIEPNEDNEVKKVAENRTTSSSEKSFYSKFANYCGKKYNQFTSFVKRKIG